MVSITSNINDVLKSLKSKQTRFKAIISNIALIVAQAVKDDMVAEINANISNWSKPYELISSVVKPESQIILVPTELGYRIEIGNNLGGLEMSDGGLVNPYYFIEFGYGIVGQNSPALKSSEYNWEYNINKHNNYWFFFGTDGKKHATKGRIGINFMYNAIQKNKNSWKNIIIQEFSKAGI